HGPSWKSRGRAADQLFIPIVSHRLVSHRRALLPCHEGSATGTLAIAAARAISARRRSAGSPPGTLICLSRQRIILRVAKKST
ncbi:MAG: hypothetical protein ACREFS_16045, partial [Acetobacteraceae bacterium]